MARTFNKTQTVMNSPAIDEMPAIRLNQSTIIYPPVRILFHMHTDTIATRAD